MTKTQVHFQSGQALVTLLFFMIIAITITSSAVVVIILNSQSASKIARTQEAFAAAESGAENALLRLLREPSYSGETIPINTNSATITVSGSNPITITSVGKAGEFLRTVQAQAEYTNNILTVTSWKEVF